MSVKSGVPSRAQVVIVGGGIVGAAIAYRLAQRGWSDVVVLEKNTLTSGTTWHAAGLITHSRTTEGAREIVTRSLELFHALEADTGFSTGFTETGTVHFATTAERMEELRYWASAAHGSGVPAEMLTTDEVVGKHPLINPSGVLGGLWYPRDGRGNATDTTMSLARGATKRGAKVLEHVTVTEVKIQGGRAVGVVTDQGEIEAEFVVNATGLWGRDVGFGHGVEIPLQALAHYYIVTDEIPDLPRGLPTIKSADEFAYVKDEGGAVMVGFFEPGSYAWSPRDERPGGFVQLPEDWDHLGPFYETMIERLPVLEDAGIRLHFSGPESFTPDGLPHIGVAPNVANYFIAAGFNSSGFMSGPGVGVVIGDWIVDGRAPFDVQEFDPARVQPHETNLRFLGERVVETLDLSYEVHWPFLQRSTARSLRRSPLFHATRAEGAIFGEGLGWERPNWYAQHGDATSGPHPFGAQFWHERSGEEHMAVRESVGLFETSSFGKILVQGPEAVDLLQTLSANDVDVEPGRLVYTPWLNEFGGIEADVTVTRVDEDSFLVLSGPATVRRDLARAKAHARGRAVTATDVTGTMAMITVMGPRARDVLQPLTSVDLSAEAFPFGTSQIIDLGYTFVRATRVTFVGELGWELLIPTEYAEHIFDAVQPRVMAEGGRMAGYYALNSLRLEKAYRSWGHDIGPHDTPLEAGLGFTVKWDKASGFIGREALEKQKARGVSRRLVQFQVEDPSKHLFHDELIWRDGVHVGRVVSAQYGHALGGAVALGWVDSADDQTPRSWFGEGHYEIEIALERFPARASLRPLYDPTSTRTKA